MPLIKSQRKLSCFQIYILILVAGVGWFPEMTDAIKCYSCEGTTRDCKTKFNENQIANVVDCEHGYCDTVTKTDRDWMRFQCSPTKKEGECIHSTFTGGCLTSSEEDLNKLLTCLAEPDSTSMTREEKTNICSCNKDLCNALKESGGTGTGSTEVFDDLFCYSCNRKGDKFDADCKTDPTLSRFKPDKRIEGCKACYKQSAGDGRIVERGCYDDITAACFKKLYGGEKCLSRQQFEELESCRNTQDKAKGRDLIQLEVDKTCACFGDWCNSAERVYGFFSSSTITFLLAILGGFVGPGGNILNDFIY